MVYVFDQTPETTWQVMLERATSEQVRMSYIASLQVLPSDGLDLSALQRPASFANKAAVECLLLDSVLDHTPQKEAPTACTVSR